MRVIQASVAKRLAFAKWARLQGFNRHSSATWKVPDDVDVPAELLAGAQIDGKVPQTLKPKAARKRTRKKAEPTSVVDETPVVTTSYYRRPEVEAEQDAQPQTEDQEE